MFVSRRYLPLTKVDGLAPGIYCGNHFSCRCFVQTSCERKKVLALFPSHGTRLESVQQGDKRPPLLGRKQLEAKYDFCFEIHNRFYFQDTSFCIAV